GRVMRAWALAALAAAVGGSKMGPAIAETPAGGAKTEINAPGKGAADRGSKQPARITVNVAALTAQLRSGDPAVIQEARVEAGAAGRGAAPLTRPVEELLAKGTTTEIDGLALTTLARIGGPSSAEVIVPYARHRSPELRKKALLALIKTGSPST